MFHSQRYLTVMKELYTSVNNNFAPLSKVEGEMREIIREQEQR